jgi:hypothetical protein
MLNYLPELGISDKFSNDMSQIFYILKENVIDYPNVTQNNYAILSASHRDGIFGREKSLNAIPIFHFHLQRINSLCPFGYRVTKSGIPLLPRNECVTNSGTVQKLKVV